MPFVCMFWWCNAWEICSILCMQKDSEAENRIDLFFSEVYIHKCVKKNATWRWREHTCPWHDLLIWPQNCNWQLPDVMLLLATCIASCEYIARYELFSSLGFWSSDIRRTDGQKAMHKSPPCIRTGVLKKLLKKLKRFFWESSLRSLVRWGCQSCMISADLGLQPVRAVCLRWQEKNIYHTFCLFYDYVEAWIVTSVLARHTSMRLFDALVPNFDHFRPPFLSQKTTKRTPYLFKIMPFPSLLLKPMHCPSCFETLSKQWRFREHLI